jgi:putative component of membrane protein insertase Oxa1/YidC/SpoIIIJ protein YidD
MLTFDVLLSRGAVVVIIGYRKYVSPYKGFSCAHRVLHGGDSCSMHIQQLVQEHGWKTAWQRAPQRFAASKAASHELRSQSDSSRAKGRKRNKKRSDWCDNCTDCVPTD